MHWLHNYCRNELFFFTFKTLRFGTSVLFLESQTIGKHKKELAILDFWLRLFFVQLRFIITRVWSFSCVIKIFYKLYTGKMQYGIDIIAL